MNYFFETYVESLMLLIPAVRAKLERPTTNRTIKKGITNKQKMHQSVKYNRYCRFFHASEEKLQTKKFCKEQGMCSHTT